VSKALDLHRAFKEGDLAALRSLLGDRTDFPNCRDTDGFNGHVLEYAIYHSPASFIAALLELGADPNYPDDAGFPSLIAAISCQERADRLQILECLISFGADVQQRGQNDYTPLHYAACLEDIAVMELLLRHGADLDARTRIDEFATPLEEARILGRQRAVSFLQTMSS
jgi:ankyrin repeat protein